MTDTQSADPQSAATEEAGYGQNPLSGMDPEMAANPQNLFKMLRDEMPVMPVDMPGGAKGVVLSRKEDIMLALRQPDVFPRTWTPSTSRTIGR